jgi:multidrug resistance efflux pump
MDGQQRYRRTVHIGAVGTVSIWRQVGTVVTLKDDERFVRTGDYLWKLDGSWCETDAASREAAAAEIDQIVAKLTAEATKLREGRDV